MAKMSKLDKVEAQIKAVTGTEIIKFDTGSIALVIKGVEIARAIPRGPFWACSIVGGGMIGMAPSEDIARKALLKVATSR